MLDALYDSQSDGITWSVPLADGTRFPVVSAYSKSEAHAVTALVVASCISLIAAVGLLFAIAMSAFNTRMVKNPNMFVRTHVVFYFVSLLLTDVLQAIGSIITSAWIRDEAVVYGSLCTAQGVIKHMADVGIAIWSSVIATRTFLVLFLRFPVKRHVMWVVLIGNWSFLFAIVIAGPATAMIQNDGPYYGIAGYWCWISADYTVQRVALDYMVMFLSAVYAFVLYSLVFLKLRGIVRAQARSTSIVSRDQERNERYEHRLARQMLLYPARILSNNPSPHPNLSSQIAYTVMIIPITCCRFSAWAGHYVPSSLTVLSDFVYLLSGLVHVILFVSTRSILPPRSMFPKFLISSPQVLLSSTAVPDNDFDSRFGGPTSTYGETEKMGPPVFIDALDPHNPFADPVLPPIDETVIKRVGSPDSEHSTPETSPRHSPGALSTAGADYIDRSFAVRPSPLKKTLTIGPGEGYPVENRTGRTSLKHREGEELEVPMSPESVHSYEAI
ncbi:hypothetical protein BJV78DRAFT_1278922 [Lactifluus subvellereus]|nr:hypothetical protein BJV78DRAFT_1278922 [Lactifluus subvellereus]